MRRMTFWFEFASTYSYLAIMRMEARAAAWSAPVAWRPFLLGPVFARRGLDTSPFLVEPEKGAFMWRDMARRAAALELPFTRVAPRFPAHSVQAARLAIAALETPSGPAFCRAVAAAGWAEGRDIADAAVLAECAQAAGLEPAALAGRAHDLKATLRANTEAAIDAGVFGAPSFTVDGELFWGEDQMEDALSWAVNRRLVPRPPR